MNKNIIKILTILLMIIFLNTIVYATTLNLNVISNKEKVEVDEEITITVNWQEGMQAADFILKYDDTKFEFIDIDIEDTFYKVKNSQVEIVWFSIDDTDKTSIELTFKALKPGKCEFETEIVGGFATGEVIMPDDYITGNTIVKVDGIIFEEIFPIIAVIVLLIVIIIIIQFKKRKK